MSRICFCLLLFFVTCPTLTQGKSLFWQDITVQAELDSNGRLHIREQQTLVFTGKWNGGERKFIIRPGHKMRFESIARLERDGHEIPLIRGSLGLVDRWSHNGKSSIRWRSRLPSDPPFNNTPITYVLRYNLSNILVPVDNGYLLNHDFCFTERSGVVKNFTLNLTFNPVWNRTPVTIVRYDIPPGDGVVYKQSLSFSGVGVPAVYSPPRIVSNVSKRSAITPAPLWLLLLCLVLLFVFILWRAVSFFRWEKSLNRFVPLPGTEEVTADWLSSEVLCHKPEVVGATWDKTTSTPEVAAVLARLVLEGKMKSTLTPYVLPLFNISLPFVPPELHLELLVDRESFTGYESELIEGLFVDDSSITSTRQIREYYRKNRKTFNPVAKLKDPMEKIMKKLTGDGVGSTGYSWVPTVLLAVVGFFILLVNAFYHQDEFIPMQLAGIFYIVFCWMIATVNGVNYRRSVVYLGWLLTMLFFAEFLLLAGFATLLIFPVSTLLLLGFFCMALAVVNNSINLARSVESLEGVAFRRRLAAARNYFVTELQRENPEIRDEWFPYLLAFGLGRDVDHWFHRYGTAAGLSHTRRSSGVSSSGGGGFTGGGGAFGGGGVSGSWSAAVGSFAGSSSASSSGGGGSGGSSGGGGGGGW